MGQNADVIKRGFEAFGRGDLDGVKEIWHDDFRWEGTNDDRLPVGGRHEGKDAAAQALAGLREAWESFSAIPDEFHESDGTVIVLGHAEATAKDSGKSVQYPFVQVWRMRDGKATEVLALSDTYEIAKTLGIAS